MTDEQISVVMHDFLKAIEAKDEDKALSFFADDGDWTAPEGVFKGKDELKRHLKWMSVLVKNRE